MAVEGEEVRFAVSSGGFVEIRNSLRVRWLEVPFALCNVRFDIDRRQAAARLDQDGAVHAMRQMLPRHALSCAVIQKRTLMLRLELESCRLTRQDLRLIRTTAITHDSVQVDAVRLAVAERIGQVNHDSVAFHYPDERPRDCPAEGPGTCDPTSSDIRVQLRRREVD